jgi:glyoxylase-like metal-dependent hydrolase (beta-lactamase superfamily II)
VHWQISEGIAAIDHGLLGGQGIGATYVVRGEAVALVETGTSLTVPATLRGLDALGISRDAVRYIVCTHVHMDHAGGAGWLAQALPHAQVVIHSTSAPHLSDPSRLMASTRRAVGEELWGYQGTMVPLAAERMLAAEGLRLDLGRDVVLEAVPTPGHSPDHMAYLERSSGALFVGDALGANFSTLGVLLPVTVVPQLDLEALRATFARVRELDPTRYLVTHFGAVDDTKGMWRYLYNKTEECAAAAKTALEREERPDAAALARRYLPAPPHLDAAATRVVETWGKMSFDGLLRYFRKQRDAAAR